MSNRHFWSVIWSVIPNIEFIRTWWS